MVVYSATGSATRRPLGGLGSAALADDGRHLGE